MACVRSIESQPQVRLTDEVVGLARAAAIEEAGAEAAVGGYAGAVAEDGTAMTGYFRAVLTGYAGWRWSVTMAHLPDEDAPWTVSEVVLLPGPDALIAPQWVPWDQRVRHGDLGVGDLLPATEDDYRLVPAYLQSDDPAIEDEAEVAEVAAVAQELGLGRVRVMSRDGRTETAERWHGGAFGPGDDMAVQAPGRCATCAFYLPLAGSLGRMFGACGNEIAPADGRVVDLEYGCGAHSEAASAALWSESAATTVIDELMMDVHHRPTDDGPNTADDDVDPPNTDQAPAAPEDPPTSSGDLVPVMLALEPGRQPIAALQPAPTMTAIEPAPVHSEASADAARMPGYDAAPAADEPPAGADPA
jgi:hypothetical protein